MALCQCALITDICSPRTLYECVPCNCYTNGSISSSCDSNGKCSCKEKFDGHKCTDRDCELNQWGQWTPVCQCGYATQRTRTRSVRIQPQGNGTQCSNDRTEPSTCTLTACDCSSKPGFYGLRCDKRDCVLHEWSGWNTHACTCPSGACTGECPTLKPRKTRSRGIRVHAAGGGNPCSTVRSGWDYCGINCVKRCYAVAFSSEYCWYNQE